MHKNTNKHKNCSDSLFLSLLYNGTGLRKLFTLGCNEIPLRTYKLNHKTLFIILFLLFLINFLRFPSNYYLIKKSLIATFRICQKHVAGRQRRELLLAVSEGFRFTLVRLNFNWLTIGNMCIPRSVRPS